MIRVRIIKDKEYYLFKVLLCKFCRTSVQDNLINIGHAFLYVGCWKNMIEDGLCYSETSQVVY